ncbi:hypothetical protein JCM9279_004124 [Rhodotorula babjevae]
MSDTSHLSPPHTPVSSVASSFLSFSPEAPRSPRTPISSAISSPTGDATPKASRDEPLSELALEAPPTRTAFRLEPPPPSRRRTKKAGESSSQEVAQASLSFGGSIGSFGSRNPFAALVAAESYLSSASPTSASSSTVLHDSSWSASSASSSSRSAPRSVKEDDLEGVGRSPDARAPLAPGLPSAASSALDTSFDVLGLDSEADLSSAWQDELYSSLSESSPVEAAFPPRIPRLSFQAPSPEQLRRSAGASAGSPRRARRAASSSPRHPFGRSAAPSSSTSAPYSPKRSPRRSSPRKVSPCDIPTRTRTLAGPATVLNQSSLSSPALEAFQLDPTSPIQPRRSPPPKLGPFGLALPSLSSSLLRSRASPPKPLGPEGSVRAAAAATASTAGASAAKQERRAAKSAARAERERAAAERAARAVDGINVEELDRFFGITPRRGKAMRGGYDDVAFQEGVVGAGAGSRRQNEREEKAWREAEEFRRLLDDALEDDAARGSGRPRAASSASSRSSSDDERSGFDVRTRRGPPPPLFTSTSLAHPSSSRTRSRSYASSTFSLDDAASALDACISLASPIDLSCTVLPSLLSSPSPAPSPSPVSSTDYRSPAPSASLYGSFASSSSWASSQASFGPRSSSLSVKGPVGSSGRRQSVTL